MRTDIAERKEEIELWISENKSKAWISKQLKCKPATLEAWLARLNLAYRGNRGSKGKTSPRRKTALEYASTQNPKSHILKVKLIEDGLKDRKCEICNLQSWLDKPIPLELDHIDGNHYNNDLSNLRILCPNCHAQTPTHAGRNKKIS